VRSQIALLTEYNYKEISFIELVNWQFSMSLLHTESTPTTILMVRSRSPRMKMNNQTKHRYVGFNLDSGTN